MRSFQLVPASRQSPPERAVGVYQGDWCPKRMVCINNPSTHANLSGTVNSKSRCVFLPKCVHKLRPTWSWRLLTYAARKWQTLAQSNACESVQNHNLTPFLESKLSHKKDGVQVTVRTTNRHAGWWRVKLRKKEEDIPFQVIVRMLHSSDAKEMGNTTFPFYFQLVLLLSRNLFLFCFFWCMISDSYARDFMAPRDLKIINKKKETTLHVSKINH